MTLKARTYLQLPLGQWGAGNVYLLVLSSVLADLADAAIFKVCDILGCTFLIPQNVYHKTIHKTWIVDINADVYNAGTIKVNINGL